MSRGLKENYHAHTWRCQHASGTEREYVEEAIRAGYRVFGFSDHTPYPFPEGYHSPIRMEVNQLEDYVDTILGLKEEYRDDIDIRLGLEVEYFPRYFDELMHLLEDYPIEYMLLGQHHVPDEVDGFYSGTPTQDEGILQEYVRLCGEAIDSGRFMYVAHPDLIHYTGDSQIYRKWMRKLADKAAEADIPLEINLLGMEGGRNYPRREFWEIAAAAGAKAILGLDAHQVTSIDVPEVVDEARKIAADVGIELIN